jgi:hypothetical protein
MKAETERESDKRQKGGKIKRLIYVNNFKVRQLERNRDKKERTAKPFSFPYSIFRLP